MPLMALTKIVSGGQTGVDRGALDAALAAHGHDAPGCVTQRGRGPAGSDPAARVLCLESNPLSGNGIDIAIRCLPHVIGTELVVAATDPTNRGHDRGRAVLNGLATETSSIAGLSPGHPAEIVAFISAVRSGETPAVTGEEGVASLEIATRCLSSRTAQSSAPQPKGPRRVAG